MKFKKLNKFPKNTKQINTRKLTFIKSEKGKKRKLRLKLRTYIQTRNRPMDIENKCLVTKKESGGEIS